MEVLIDNRQEGIIIDEKVQDLIFRAIDLCLEKEHVTKELEISISFVDNEEIRQLNRDYRRIDKITDVLSFPQYEDINEIKNGASLGDIVISLEKAKEQAIEFGHSFSREVIFLSVHSMFHLLGYDHDTRENTQRMRQKEEEILSVMGILRE